MLRELNSTILRQASKLSYTVADSAPNTEIALYNTPSLVIWSGESDNTIWGDASVNWAFRALHDTMHLATRLGFSASEEMTLGRIQASQYTGLLADLVYIEIIGQAEHYMLTGRFVDDQVKFTLDKLQAMGYRLSNIK